MYELSKSIQRRLHDSNFVTRYFVGAGIDIGAGNDSLAQYRELFPLITSVRGWNSTTATRKRWRHARTLNSISSIRPIAWST